MKIASEIKQLSDVDLLEHMCAEADDSVYYAEFLKRYLKILQEKCVEICNRRKLDRHLGLEIAHSTLEKVRSSKSFRKEKLKPGDEKSAIVGFLYRISINLFNDHHNNNKPVNAVLPSYLDSFTSQTNGITRKHDDQTIKEYSARILSKLNPKEKKLLLVDLEYKRHQKYLPDDVVTTLCNELGIKPSSLRKMRERLIIKIQKEIDVINGEHES